MILKEHTCYHGVISQGEDQALSDSNSPRPQGRQSRMERNGTKWNARKAPRPRRSTPCHPHTTPNVTLRACERIPRNRLIETADKANLIPKIGCSAIKSQTLRPQPKGLAGRGILGGPPRAHPPPGSSLRSERHGGARSAPVIKSEQLRNARGVYKLGVLWVE